MRELSYTASHDEINAILIVHSHKVFIQAELLQYFILLLFCIYLSSRYFAFEKLDA